MEREVAPWVVTHNAVAMTIGWRFTTADALTRLKRLYPMFEA